ncbi:hypothetical protein GCM10028801_46180 [Nocardioides maradonensis]
MRVADRPDLLASHVISLFRGDFLFPEGRHGGSRRGAIAVQLTYAAVAAIGSAWLIAHPGRFGYRLVGSVPLASSAGVAFILAILTTAASTGRPQLMAMCVRWGRRAAAVYEYAATGLVAACSATGIGLALYAAHLDAHADTRLVRGDAFAFAYMAGGLSIGAAASITRPLFSVVRGRPRTVAHVLAASAHVLVGVALFGTLAELVIPGTSTWVTVAVTLTLTGIGWQIARFTSAEHTLRRLLDAATALRSASARGDDLVGPLAELENACLRRTLGRELIVEPEVQMVLRACIERLAPEERRVRRHGTAMADLDAAFAGMTDESMRTEVAKFAAAIRQTIVLKVPLVEGHIWAVPLTESPAPERPAHARYRSRAT